MNGPESIRHFAAVAGEISSMAHAVAGLRTSGSHEVKNAVAATLAEIWMRWALEHPEQAMAWRARLDLGDGESSGQYEVERLVRDLAIREEIERE